MSIPTFTPATYTVAETGRYRTADGRDVYDITAGTVISMKQAIDLGMPNAGYVSISPFQTVEEERVGEIAVPLTGLEQRTDRFEPIDSRVSVVAPSAVFTSNSVYLSHFRLARDFTVTKLGMYIGSIAAGNVDLGIATSDDMATFTKAASTGSVAAGATSAMMEQSLTSPYTCLAGVDYWFMFGLTDATLILKYTQSITAIGIAQKSGLSKASAWSSGLPASVTSVAGGAFQPWFTLIA